MKNDLKKYKVFFIISTVILFMSFSLNIFGAMTSDAFSQNFRDSEALVANQVKCRGELYSDQLILQKNENISSDAECSTENYIPYSSQFGLQGKIHTIGYAIFSKIFGIPANYYIVAARLFTGLISALVLALLALWVRSRFGLICASVVLSFVATSPMLIGFAENLYWMLPLMVLPVVYIMYGWSIKNRDVKKFEPLFYVGLFVLLYLRYLCGYEYLTTLTLLPIAVMCYFMYLDKSKYSVYIKTIIIAGLVSILAFSAAFCTHVFSLNYYTGSTSKSITIISERAKERTVSPEKYVIYPYLNLNSMAPDFYKVSNQYIDYSAKMESNSVKWAALVAFMNYLLLPVFHLPIFESTFALYFESTFVFVLALVLLYIKRRSWAGKLLREVEALFFACAVGFLGYLSWLIMAFSHSLVHAHINGILIYLPAAFFGFIIIGMYIQNLAKAQKK